MVGRVESFLLDQGDSRPSSLLIGLTPLDAVGCQFVVLLFPSLTKAFRPKDVSFSNPIFGTDRYS